MTTTTDVDVLIVGAGISGICAAMHLTQRLPDRTYAVLERRDSIGGTWDLFRYPGIRCDSDMQTLGFELFPWPSDSVITGGEEIRRYLHEAADAFGVDEHIRFGHGVTRASWDSLTARWTVRATVEATGEQVEFTASFLVGGTGYYSHDEAHVPELPGLDAFEGEVVHPQFWGEDVDHADKRVVIVGSGATAVTLLPSLAEQAAHVTMLQRSPGYVLTLPEHDPTSALLRRVLPDDAVGHVVRARNTLLQLGLFRASRRFPRAVRSLLLAQVAAQVGVAATREHFTPSYDPWDERLCVVPDGDLFRAIRGDRADVVTDHIETFTPTGVRLRSGRHLDADIVVTATGLQLQLVGGIELVVDGDVVDPADRLTYNGVMLADVPNFAMIFGYVNVSWTRKADLAAAYVCRVLAEMDRRDADRVVPRPDGAEVSDDPFMDLRSNYVTRNAGMLPLQGERGAWRNSSNVLLDTVRMRLLPLRDPQLEFTPRHRAVLDDLARGPRSRTRRGATA